MIEIRKCFSLAALACLLLPVVRGFAHSTFPFQYFTPYIVLDELGAAANEKYTIRQSLVVNSITSNHQCPHLHPFQNIRFELK